MTKNDPLKHVVGQNIKALREHHRLTQRELADASNISQVTLVSIESGSSATNLDILERLAQQLNTTPEKLAVQAPVYSPANPPEFPEGSNPIRYLSRFFTATRDDEELARWIKDIRAFLDAFEGKSSEQAADTTRKRG